MSGKQVTVAFTAEQKTAIAAVYGSSPDALTISATGTDVTLQLVGSGDELSLAELDDVAGGCWPKQWKVNG